jgi:hypothetical protein
MPNIISTLIFEMQAVIDTSNWVNGKPVLQNGDVFCPMCDAWHQNNTFCQQ